MKHLRFWAAGDAAQQKAENFIERQGGQLVYGDVYVPECDDVGKTYYNAVGVVGKTVEPESGDEYCISHGREDWNKTVFTVKKAISGRP